MLTIPPEQMRKQTRGSRVALMIHRIARSLLLFGTLFAFAAGAEVATLDVLVDLDLDTATGCDVATIDGPAEGIERRLTMDYDVSLGSVTALSSASCVDEVAGVFSIPTPVSTSPAPPWPGSTGDGLAGSTSIEAHFPLSIVGYWGEARLHASLASVVGQDATHEVAVGTPIIVSFGAAPVSGIGRGAAALAIALAILSAMALVAGPRPGWRGIASAIAALAVLSAIAPGPVRALLGTGVERNWSAAERVAIDPAGDAPVGADMRALWVASDPATQELWIRADVAFGAPVCLDWGRVDPGTGYSCAMQPPPDSGPFGGQVALTFDDGPHPTTTPQILAILRAHSIPATFFMTGFPLTNPVNQAIALDIHQDPLFRVANHTINHPYLTTLTDQEVENEILGTSNLIREAIGDPCYFPAYFRFPYSNTNCTTMSIVRSLGHAVAGVNFTPHDWCYGQGNGWCDPAIAPWMPLEFQNDLPGFTVHEFQTTNGGILLLHDPFQNTADNLEAIISGLEAAGATFVDLDDLVLFPTLQSWINPPEAPACCQDGSSPAP